MTFLGPENKELPAYKELQARLTQIQREEGNVRVDLAKTEEKTKQQIIDEANKKRADMLAYGNDAADASQAIVDAGFEKRKNQIQVEMDLNDVKLQKDIAAVNASTLSAQDKAARIIVFEAQATAAKDANIRKQKKLDYDKAVFDKGIAIVKTIAGIAMNLAEIPPNFLAAAAAGVALIKLIATPIPKYKSGRGEGKDELAIVDDGGRNEPILRASGKIELSRGPAKERLTYLKSDDVVFPDIASLSRLMGKTQNTDSMVLSILKANNLLHVVQKAHDHGKQKTETIYEDPLANRYRKEQVRAIERVERAIREQNIDQPIIGNSWYEQFHLKH